MKMRLFYLLGFFGDLMFFYPFYNVMFYSAGMTHFDVSMLIVTMQLSKMLFDLPGGLLFDKYGKNFILVSAQMLRLVFLGLWICFKTKIFFFAGMFLFGVSMSFLFGNTEAYMYQCIDLKSREKVFRGLLAKYYGFQNVAILLSGLLGAFIFRRYSFNGVLLCSAVSVAVALGVLLFLPNDKKSGASRMTIGVWWKELKLTASIKNLNLKVLLSAFHEMTFLFFIDLQTNYMALSGVSAERISLVVGVVAGLKILTSFVSGRCVDFFSIERIVVWGVLIFGGLFASVILNNWLLIMFFIVGAFLFYSFVDVSIKSRMQTSLTSINRGTVMSGASLLSSVGAAILNISNGMITRKFSHDKAFQLISALLFCVALCFYIFKSENKKRP